VQEVENDPLTHTVHVSRLRSLGQSPLTSRTRPRGVSLSRSMLIRILGNTDGKL
jgi:hypothetical protein